MKQRAVFDAIILGAGPYGLSVAAHLRASGKKIAVFGKPMYLWKERMPKGMWLRSRWWASSLSDPKKQFSIAQYFRHINKEPYDPLTIEDFTAYCLWFQKYVVPDVDDTYIKTIEKKADHFEVSLVDGRVLQAKNVVMAPGLGYFAYRPEAFANFPKKFVSHTADNYPFRFFKNKRVVIVGGGQSGLENAALLNEAGVDVHVVSRSPFTWLEPPLQKNRLQYLRHPKAGIADGWDNWFLEHTPYVFNHLPRSVKTTYLSGMGKNGPAGSHWLIPRLKGATLHENERIERITQPNHHVSLKLSSGKTLKADHILLATGYIPDMRKLPMLGDSIIKHLHLYNGSPELTNYFETNIPGLYFVGFSAHISFGPLYRFVVGTDAAAKRITQALSR